MFPNLSTPTVAPQREASCAYSGRMSTRRRALFLSLATLALCYGQSQSLEQFAQSHLPKGMELAHPPVAGSFGPSGRHIVLLYRPEADDTGEFKGTVYLGGERPHDLPPLALIPNQFAIEVKAIFFEQTAGSVEPALFILYGYHRNGSEADDGHACAVYQWRDNHFVRSRDTENKVARLATASAVRLRLRQLIPTLKKQATGGPKK